MAVFQIRWSTGNREETLLACKNDALVVSVYHFITLVTFDVARRIVADMEAIDVQSLCVGHVDISEPFVAFNGGLKMSRITIALVEVSGEPLVHRDGRSNVQFIGDGVLVRL